MNKKRNDFKIIHSLFVSFYILTYILSFVRTQNEVFYWAHSISGNLTLIAPLVFYIISKNKKTIRKIIASNFNLKGKPLVKVAKASSALILVYFTLTVITGISIGLGFVTSDTLYDIFSSIHKANLFVVPVLVITHVTARVMLKGGSSK